MNVNSWAIRTKSVQTIERAHFSMDHKTEVTLHCDSGEPFTGIVEKVLGTSVPGQADIVGCPAEHRNTYLTRDDAERYYDQLEASNHQRMRRRPDVTFISRDYEAVGGWQASLIAGIPTSVYSAEYGPLYGFVTMLRPRAEIDGVVEFEVTVRPTSPLPKFGLSEFLNKYTYGVKRSGTVTFPINYEEQNMKVYEAIVVKLDEKGEVTEVAKIIPPFVAKNAVDAAIIVRVDYAQEQGLTGKDAAAIQVRVREFQIS